MSSIITEVFKATIGLLVNKGRDKATEKLKDGDVTDQKFRGLIIREIEDIKGKLDGQARKDLLASMSFFKEGIELMYAVFEKATWRNENDASVVQVSNESASDEGFSLAKELINLKLEISGLDEATTKSLDKAKKRFEDARRKATEAFANEGLKLSDRLIAMEYRIMATILEAVDNPENALRTCKVGIEELHGLSIIQRSFKVELKKGIRAWFGKEERVKIIANVCHINRVIHDVTKMISTEFVTLPCLDTGGEKVDLLYDGRVARLLKEQGMEHCCVRWSFGQEGAEENKLMGLQRGIAANSDRQFLIADGDTLKVFDIKGNFHVSVRPSPTEPIVYDVATSVVYDDNVYLLVGTPYSRSPSLELQMHVYVLNQTADLVHNFFTGTGGQYPRLAVSCDKMLILNGLRVTVVEVYNKQDGKYHDSFGKEMISSGKDITVSKDGRVMVLDGDQPCVHVFTGEGQHLSKFSVQGRVCCGIACHPASEHVVLAGKEIVKHQAIVDIYSMSGDLVRSIRLGETLHKSCFPKITVSQEGHIAVIVTDEQNKTRVIVI